MRRLLWPGLMSLAMFATLIGLGVWQLHRLAWKQALLAEIEAAAVRPPVPLAEAGRPDPFQRVAAAGRLRTDLAARYGAEVREGRMGAQVLAVLERGSAAPLLVDLGWAPEGWVLGGGVPPPGADVRLTGFLRPAEHPGWLSPRDDAPGRHFYTLDPAAIGAALGAGGLAPYTLVVLAPETGEGGVALPAPARGLPRPPNDHLTYAATWFGLAAVLAVVFALWARKTLTQEGKDR